MQNRRYSRTVRRLLAILVRFDISITERPGLVCGEVDLTGLDGSRGLLTPTMMNGIAPTHRFVHITPSVWGMFKRLEWVRRCRNRREYPDLWMLSDTGREAAREARLAINKQTRRHAA